ncbi:MAG: phage holin family protein [Egibacteraceae bacterium]
MPRLESANGLQERPLKDLVRLLADQATMLVNQEIQLAKAELLEKKTHAKPALTALVAAGVFGVICLAALTVLMITGLSGLGLPLWAGALLLAVVAGIVALALAMSGKRKLKTLSLMPEETVLTLKEDLRWAKLQRISVAR